MPFSVSLTPSGHAFQVEDHETVLAAGLRAGVGLPYGCKNGACGSCKGHVSHGTVDQLPHQASALSPEEAVRGYALLCCAKPLSDITVDIREVRGLGDIPIKKLPCRVADVQRPASDVAVLKLQLPATERFQYLAGQYIELILKDGRRRSYSMANAPETADQIELHIRHMPGGIFTDHVFGVGPTQLKVRDILRFEGPFGSFSLREDSERPMILLASGTGFAPVKALIERMVQKQMVRPAVLYWGGRRPQDLYMSELAKAWAESHPFLRYIPVVSEPTTDDGWTGRTGFVHRAVMDDFPDLSEHQVYACGAPLMVEAARHDFTTLCHLPQDEFISDAFTSEADLARDRVGETRVGD